MQSTSCFFIGHRNISSKIYPRVLAEVERHITEFGVREFCIGHYGAFDSIAARAVKEAKKRYPDVRLIMLLPYHPGLQPIEIPPFFDGSYFPEGLEKVPHRAAILRANEHMIHNVAYLICYVNRSSGGARAVLDAALAREKRGLIRVTNLSGCTPNI